MKVMKIMKIIKIIFALVCSVTSIDGAIAQKDMSKGGSDLKIISCSEFQNVICQN